jgi:hypothetical protein
MKWLVSALFLAIFGTAHAQVRGELGGVYVAGEGFDFEQAAADALRDRVATPSAERLILLVLGRDLPKVTRQRATPETPGMITKLAAANVAVFVCERDVRAQRVGPSELLAGVRIERGWTRAEAAANVGERQAAKDGTPELRLRRVRRLCAET